MQAPLYYLSTIAVLAVLTVLLMGLWNLMRKNRSSNLSQKLMRWRVGLQFLAILLIIGYLLVKA
ncbi:MAG: twin transmembrane helix small protein [Hyphomicrobiaceae bacterium]|nr:twin transmembrane helix small protein [Hyphomicrobiaceae bacterium]MCC0009501.1 twin transmembrane helix small protein [Hyphomicrobiaceae bacterium]